MSRDVYVIVQDGDGLESDKLVCWFDTLHAAEHEANLREWADYQRSLESPARGGSPLSPDETEYRKYTVQYVPMG